MLPPTLLDLIRVPSHAVVFSGNGKPEANYDLAVGRVFRRGKRSV